MTRDCFKTPFLAVRNRGFPGLFGVLKRSLLIGHREDLHLLGFVLELAAVGLPIEDQLSIGGQPPGFGQENQLGMWFAVRFEDDVLHGSLVRQTSNRRFM